MTTRFETVTITHYCPGSLVAETRRFGEAPFRWNPCGTVEQVLDQLNLRGGNVDLGTVTHVDGLGRTLDDAEVEARRVAHLREFGRTVARTPWLRQSGSRRAVAALDTLNRQDGGRHGDNGGS